MDSLPTILIAAAVAGFVLAVWFVVNAASSASKRKLQQRLTSEGAFDHSQSASASLRLRDQEQFSQAAGAFRPIQVMRRRLAQAFPTLPLGRFLMFCAVLAMLGGAIAWVASESTAVACIGAVAGAYLPWFLVGRKRAKWKTAVTQQIPEALDFLSRVLRAGQSLSTALQMMSEELAPPLAGEFRRCYDQHGLGQPIEEGLKEMALRLESQDFAFFVTAVMIQRQSGGDLAELLQNISMMIRQRLRLQQSVKAKTAEGRFTGYIMVAFPAVMFVLCYFMNPQRGGMLLYSHQGHVLLAIAVGLQCLGFFLIKRITTVRV